MTDVLFQIAGFLLGVHLTMMLLGSLYRIIDLYFCLREFWLEITARIALNAGLIAMVYWLGPTELVVGFSVGQLFYALFHISIFWLGQLLLRLISRR